jgi:propanol-preferring alcohol dehydrogenase
MSPLVGGLVPGGKMIAVGVAGDSIEVSTLDLVLGTRSHEGSLTGTAIDGEETLSFSVLGNVRPMIETVPLEKAPEAYARMMKGEARLRMGLVTGQ